eukprot:708865-Pyramimonas_sp.AAC.1
MQKCGLIRNISAAYGCAPHRSAGCIHSVSAAIGCAPHRSAGKIASVADARPPCHLPGKYRVMRALPHRVVQPSAVLVRVALLGAAIEQPRFSKCTALH